jgi:hypothetical protein
MWHPGWQFVVELLVAVGTLSLAAVTFSLVRRTAGMVDVSERALSVGIRPLLADPRPAGFSDFQDEQLLFGAPGRISPTVPWGQLWWQSNSDGSVPYFSVAFENIGADPLPLSRGERIPRFSEMSTCLESSFRSDHCCV